MSPSENHRLDQLQQAAGAGPVLILTHDNPDPDALASGKALATLLQSAWDVPSRLVYSGLVARADNRAMLRRLTPEWEHQDEITDLEQYAALALVDTQPGAGNNRMPATDHPKLIFDHHHPIRPAMPSISFSDIRPELGATVTLMFEYMQAADLVPSKLLATAMFYGLRTDTRGLSRGASPADKDAYLQLLAAVDHMELIQVEHAGLNREHFRALDRGLRAARIHGKAVVARLGTLDWPDQAAEMTDLLIRLEGARAALCQGEHQGVLHLSLRTKLMQQDAGELVQHLIVAPGKGGGHGSMAGGQYPLSDRPAEQVMAEVEQRFLTVMDERPAGHPLIDG